MTTQQLPVELQDTHSKLRSLHKPAEPYLNDTVGDSESALEGESVIGLALYAMLPWWLEGMADSGSGNSHEGKDYLIGIPLTFVSMATYLGFTSQLEWWNVFSFSMMTAAGVFLGLIVFHLIFHKCISMVIYNRVFRRAWMKKMRIADQQNYEAEIASYPQRLQEYDTARTQAVNEATIALASYHAGNPSRRYNLGEYGFEQVTLMENVFNAAEAKVRGIFGRFLNR